MISRPEDEGAVLVGDREGRDGQGVVLDVAIVRKHVAGSGGVFSAGTDVLYGDRRVVDVRDGEAEGACAGKRRLLGDNDVRNRISDGRKRAEVILLAVGGRERVIAVGADAQDTLDGAGDGDVGLGVGGSVGSEAVDRIRRRTNCELRDAKLGRKRGIERVGVVLRQVAGVDDGTGIDFEFGDVVSDGDRLGVDVDLERTRRFRDGVGDFVRESELAGIGPIGLEGIVTVGGCREVADGRGVVVQDDRRTGAVGDHGTRGRTERDGVLGDGERVGVRIGDVRVGEDVAVDRTAAGGRAVGQRGRTDGRGGVVQQAAVVSLALDKGVLRDAAGRVFERPVATQFGGAGLVDRRGDVGGGELGKGIDERLTGGASGDIATVQQDVRVRGKRTGNGLQVSGTRKERIGGIRAAAEDQLAVRTVADDRHGTDVRQFGQGLRDLGEAILGRVEADDQRGRIGLRDELLPALDRCIHKHHNAFRRFGRGARRQRGGLRGLQELRGVVERLLRLGELLLGRKLLGINLLDFAALGQDAELGGGHEEPTVEHVARFEGAEPELRPLQTAEGPGDVLEGEFLVRHESI